MGLQKFYPATKKFQKALKRINLLYLVLSCSDLIDF